MNSAMMSQGSLYAHWLRPNQNKGPHVSHPITAKNAKCKFQIRFYKPTEFLLAAYMTTKKRV